MLVIIQQIIGDGMAITSKKYFNNLDNKEKDKLRREYRATCFKEYRYSIHLFITQSVLGGVACFGLLVLLLWSKFLGSLIFVISFIFVLITTYFLNLSNKSFYEFINKKRIK